MVNETYLKKLAHYPPMIEDVLRRSNPWWGKEYNAPGIPRDEYLDRIFGLMGQERMIILSGLRRVGKTTIMKQLVSRFMRDMESEHILFASIDHPELERTPLYELLREFRRINGLKSGQEVMLLLDEVQSRPDFEKELKAIYDLEEHVKIVASGSSSLVIRHRGAHLVGRFRSIHIEPLTFREYVHFKGEEPDHSEPELMENLMDRYLLDGGIPEYVLSSDQGYITELVTNIIYRDICTTYGVKDPRRLKDLYFLLMGRVGKKMSYSKLARLVGVGNDAVKRYVGYFEESFLLHVVEQDGTPNERKYGPRTCYAPDNGICSVISGSGDTGPLAETLVYLKLRRTCEPRYVDKGGMEVDFLCGRDAYEVKYKASITDKDTKAIESFNKKGIKNRLLITRSRRTEAKAVASQPLWEFLLER